MSPGCRALAAGLLLCSNVWGFPGVLVGKGNGARVVHTVHEAVMLKGNVSVVTIMIDYDGPLDPFALLMPVPTDVTPVHVQAVKREFMARLEQLSAPRYHAFYEMDPCQEGEVEQDWDVRYQAADSGFLAPPFMPPPERNWTVPNEIGIATKPVFKGGESEFRFHVLPLREPLAIKTWLSKRGYNVSPDVLDALSRGLQKQPRLLVAEVNVQRAELLGNGGLQLGGIRYWSREPFTEIEATLGLQNSAPAQDLFIYVLHPNARYQAKNRANLFLPTNLEVDAEAAEHLAGLYNAVFDAKLTPGAAVTEFVWPTHGCGEPCPNAPLTLYELMSLGGDVMESEFVSPAARNPDPGPESDPEKQEFELQVQGKSTLERTRAIHQHQKDRWELARRRALIARQRYVLSRLHLRYDRNTLQSDVELEPTTEPIEGGIGIPAGPQGLLFNGARRGQENRYQTRFVNLFVWDHGMQCPKLTRWRWGRRWKSLDSVWRKVWLAEDLPHNSRDKGQIAKWVHAPLPELGVAATPPTQVSTPKPVKRSSCAVEVSRGSSSCPLLLTLVVVLVAVRNRTS
jgi:hypothetical protein